jgi:hypothetical protein
VSALFGLPPPLIRWLALAMVAAVVGLVAWALQLMQAANDRRDFSLMLAGCMVCSAAVGLSTVMVLTFTSPESFSLHPPLSSLEPISVRGDASEIKAGWQTTTPWESLPLQGRPPL